jgi:hypothetical protein
VHLTLTAASDHFPRGARLRPTPPQDTTPPKLWGKNFNVEVMLCLKIDVMFPVDKLRTKVAFTNWKAIVSQRNCCGLCGIILINTQCEQVLKCVFELVNLPTRNVNRLLVLLTHNTAVIGLWKLYGRLNKFEPGVQRKDRLHRSYKSRIWAPNASGAVRIARRLCKRFKSTPFENHKWTPFILLEFV